MPILIQSMGNKGDILWLKLSYKVHIPKHHMNKVVLSHWMNLINVLYPLVLSFCSCGCSSIEPPSYIHSRCSYHWLHSCQGGESIRSETAIVVAMGRSKGWRRKGAQTATECRLLRTHFWGYRTNAHETWKDFYLFSGQETLLLHLSPFVCHSLGVLNTLNFACSV